MYLFIYFLFIYPESTGYISVTITCVEMYIDGDIQIYILNFFRYLKCVEIVYK